MKILYVTTISRTMNFFVSLINELVEQGNQVDIATNMSIDELDNNYKKIKCKTYHIPFSRSVTSIKTNFHAYKELKKLLATQEYDIIHTHTPIASAIVRLVCKHLKINSRVIYTAHGFHFFKGAPLKNWLLCNTDKF